VSECAAACCSVLQCVALCCSVLQCVAICCSVLQCIADSSSLSCNVLQCVAVCCSVFPCVAVCCGVLQRGAVCCSVLQCVALCCCVLQCVATCCSVLQWVTVRAHSRKDTCGKRHASPGRLVSSLFANIFPQMMSCLSTCYRVAKTHRMPNLYRSFSAKEPYIQWLFCRKWHAT